MRRKLHVAQIQHLSAVEENFVLTPLGFLQLLRVLSRLGGFNIEEM